MINLINSELSGEVKQTLKLRAFQGTNRIGNWSDFKHTNRAHEPQCFWALAIMEMPAACGRLGPGLPHHLGITQCHRT